MINLTMDNKVKINVMYKIDNGDNIPLVVDTDWRNFLHDVKVIVIEHINNELSVIYDDKERMVLMEYLRMATRLKYNNIDDVALVDVSHALGFKISINYIDVFN
ncbi:hypothetical protein vBSscSF1_41 [Staphylococcus phage vB-SscS-F1]|nr:hypothetical protein vBApySJF1_41 [Arcanobacterium phage vB-ApyS-JF1]